VRSAGWLAPNVTVKTVGEIDLVEVTTYSGSVVACSAVTYEIGGVSKSGALGPIFSYLSGTLQYNNSAAMTPSGGQPSPAFFDSVAACVSQGLKSYGSQVFAKVMP